MGREPAGRHGRGRAVRHLQGVCELSSAAEIVPMQIELADPHSPEARRLLEAHASDMADRYQGAGSWEGVNGRKDMLWLARAD